MISSLHNYINSLLNKSMITPYWSYYYLITAFNRVRFWNVLYLLKIVKTTVGDRAKECHLLSTMSENLFWIQFLMLWHSSFFELYKGVIYRLVELNAACAITFSCQKGLHHDILAQPLPSETLYWKSIW